MTRSLFPEYRQKQQQQQDEQQQYGTDNNNNIYKNREPTVFQQMQDITLEYLEQMEANSTLFSGSNNNSNTMTTSRCIPQLEPHEVQLGKMLGMGEFGVLLKVTGIRLLSSHEKSSSDHHSNPALDSHRFAASSVNLFAAATKTKPDTYQETTHDIHHQLASTTHIGGGFAMANESFPPFTSSTQSDMSQSITIAKLAHPGPLPIEKRTTMQQQSLKELLIRSTATCIDAEQAQILREELSAQVSYSNTKIDNERSDRTTATHSHLHKRKLAMKQVRGDLYPKKRLEAAKDLAREAKLLARLHHPSIICLRGVVSQPGRVEFGLLLDRLSVTLSEDVVYWNQRQEEIVASHRTPVVTPVLEVFSSLFQQQQQQQQQQQPSSKGKKNLTVDKKSQGQGQLPPKHQHHPQHYTKQALWLLGERVLALWDIARGMQYLHRHKILFRDLKTENVGTLPVDDDFIQQQQQHQRRQIFDFGLAKECKAVFLVTTEEQHVDEQSSTTRESIVDFYSTYHMTGLTGTLRIMAPEVIQCFPYGLPADVYSFGVCLWEVFSGTKDDSLTLAEICNGARPTIPSIDRISGAGMPSSLQSLLHRCWAQDPFQRPNFVEIGQILYKELVELQQRQQSMSSSSRQSSQSNTRSNSRSSSPLGWNLGGGGNDTSSTERIHKAAAQAAFWKRLDTIHSSSTILEESSPYAA